MASAGAVAIESPARRELGSLTGPECSAEALRKADSLQARSSLSLHGASSGDAGPPRHKRARRDVVRRVWDWLEVSGSRDQPLGLGSASDAVQFGQMHLSEGSPATTVITTALDVSRGDAIEPCVSSLPDAQANAADTVCVSSRPTESAAEPPEEAPQLPASASPAQEHGLVGSPRSQVGHGPDMEDRNALGAEASLEQHTPSGAAAEATGAAAYQALLDAALQSQGGSGQWTGTAGQGAADGSPTRAGGPLQRQGSRKRKHSCQHAEPAHADGYTTRSASAEVQH